MILADWACLVRSAVTTRGGRYVGWCWTERGGHILEGAVVQESTSQRILIQSVLNTCRHFRGHWQIKIVCHKISLLSVIKLLLLEGRIIRRQIGVLNRVKKYLRIERIERVLHDQIGCSGIQLLTWLLNKIGRLDLDRMAMLLFARAQTAIRSESIAIIAGRWVLAQFGLLNLNKSGTHVSRLAGLCIWLLFDQIFHWTDTRTGQRVTSDLIRSGWTLVLNSYLKKNIIFINKILVTHLIGSGLINK